MPEITPPLPEGRLNDLERARIEQTGMLGRIEERTMNLCRDIQEIKAEVMSLRGHIDENYARREEFEELRRNVTWLQRALFGAVIEASVAIVLHFLLR